VTLIYFDHKMELTEKYVARKLEKTGAFLNQ
jgi:hypothetical protein